VSCRPLIAHLFSVVSDDPRHLVIPAGVISIERAPLPDRVSA